MARNDQKRRDQARPEKRAPRGEKPSREQRAEEHGHRLRGEEFTEDFVDADKDSCAAARHRDDKESES